MQHKLVIFALALLVAAPASAAPRTLTLTDDEQKVLIELLDLAVKQGGLSVAGSADFLLRKIQTAPEAVPSAPPAAPAPTEK